MRASKPIVRVVLHQDVVWLAGGFRRYLSPVNGFVLIESSGQVDMVLDECLRVAPCVLITDLAFLSEVNLAELGERVEYGRLVQVMVMGPEEYSTVAESLLGAGCMGFVADDVVPSRLKKALRAVAAAEIWAGRKAVARALRNSLIRASCDKLTKREIEILRLIGDGLTNQAIADRLFISRETVRWHIRSLYSKAGLSDRLHAALYAKRALGDQLIDLGSFKTGARGVCEFGTSETKAS